VTDGTEFVSRLLDVIENDVVPLTRDRVATGNKVFGAAILRKADCTVVVAESNLETENPLWHGEVHALKTFYEIPADERPDTGDCIFLATHEPCSVSVRGLHESDESFGRGAPLKRGAQM
jgi:tRNA(Arg) A34 adenosine deaminase TadA